MKYEVEVLRISYSIATTTIEAENETEASKKASDNAWSFQYSEEFDWDYQIEEVSEVEESEA